MRVDAAGVAGIERGEGLAGDVVFQELFARLRTPFDGKRP